MATSDSDGDFESADEELNFRDNSMINPRNQKRGHVATIDSDSDDDNECIPSSINTASWSSEISTDFRRDRAAVGKHLNSQKDQPKNLSTELMESDKVDEKKKPTPTGTLDNVGQEDKEKNIKSQNISEEKKDIENIPVRKQRPERQRKIKEQKPTGFGAKKLGSKIFTDTTTSICVPVDRNLSSIDKGNNDPSIIQECWEFDDEEATKILQKECNSGWSKSKDEFPSNLEDVPEELKSNKSFKEIFKPDKWEPMDEKIKVSSEFNKDEVQSLSSKMEDKPAEVIEEKSSGGWGSWGGWGYNTLINTANMASMGVTTLSNHVSHGLTLLEESIADPEESRETSDDSKEILDEKKQNVVDNQSMTSFGFGNFMYGVSSITKLVESTGTKVISGGLGTLETIGKKTMEVLQEGDPGLKKKRAFFMNEDDKPILSRMLREAKDKADVEEKSVEGKQLARKVHFETLFDDFQGLVHLEALEMLSKQSNMKIQQRLATLDFDEMTSLQETIDEVKELCDLGDEDDEDDSENGKLIEKLQSSCSDLGVAITYDKINEIWEKTTTYITDVSKPENTSSDIEIFQCAISTLAQFTAYSVERFHKTAELLLIKERRSTVNEADSLVQLTKILSGQIGVTASLFSKCLNERSKKSENSGDSVNITTIFLEATNASSYIQDAFRLLIPILQIGAI